MQMISSSISYHNEVSKQKKLHMCSAYIQTITIIILIYLLLFETISRDFQILIHVFFSSYSIIKDYRTKFHKESQCQSHIKLIPSWYQIYVGLRLALGSFVESGSGVQNDWLFNIPVLIQRYEFNHRLRNTLIHILYEFYVRRGASEAFIHMKTSDMDLHDSHT